MTKRDQKSPKQSLVIGGDAPMPSNKKKEKAKATPTAKPAPSLTNLSLNDAPPPNSEGVSENESMSVDGGPGSSPLSKRALEKLNKKTKREAGKAQRKDGLPPTSRETFKPWHMCLDTWRISRDEQ